MMYPDGLHVEASCDAHDVSGTLVGDHDELDGPVIIREDDTGEVLRLNGWLWLFTLGTACAETELVP